MIRHDILYCRVCGEVDDGHACSGAPRSAGAEVRASMYAPPSRAWVQNHLRFHDYPATGGQFRWRAVADELPDVDRWVVVGGWTRRGLEMAFVDIAYLTPSGIWCNRNPANIESGPTVITCWCPLGLHDLPILPPDDSGGKE